jgi:hypothetical protein
MTATLPPTTPDTAGEDLIVHPAEAHSCYPLALRSITDPDEIAVGVCTRDNGVPASWCVLDERMAREVHAYLTRWIAARDVAQADVPAQRRRRTR